MALNQSGSSGQGEEFLKVLFLDIDGVLNSRRTATAFGNFPHNCDPHQMKLFDRPALSLIQKLCEKTDSSVVLSSTWRNDPRWREYGRQLRIPLIDRTPSQSGPRGREIQTWIDINGPKRYAIVDDDSDMLEHQKPFFVQTDPQDGLLLRHYDRLLELLS